MRFMEVGTLSTVEEARKKIIQLEKHAQREKDPTKTELYEFEIDAIKEAFCVGDD